MVAGRLRGRYGEARCAPFRCRCVEESKGGIWDEGHPKTPDLKPRASACYTAMQKTAENSVKHTPSGIQSFPLESRLADCVRSIQPATATTMSASGVRSLCYACEDAEYTIASTSLPSSDASERMRMVQFVLHATPQTHASYPERFQSFRAAGSHDSTQVPRRLSRNAVRASVFVQHTSPRKPARHEMGSAGCDSSCFDRTHLDEHQMAGWESAKVLLRSLAMLIRRVMSETNAR